MNRVLTAALGLAVTGLAGAPAVAQSNGNPNIDVELAFLDNIQRVGHTGAFPTGESAIALSTTICNRGTEIVPWFAPMNENHPLITFIIARESNGKFEQISDWSYVKHGFFALTSSQCTPCTPPPGGAGDNLGIGCSDTYGVGNNGDNFWLGPPEEIDPWLGLWNAQCSFFDGGLTPTPPSDCDGFRTFSQTQAASLGPIGNRIRVQDADLAVPGAEYWYQGYYVVRTELDLHRSNNMAHRGMTVSGSGTVSSAGGLQNGTILKRWTGAVIGSNTNGDDDGRVYVGVTATEIGPGSYHYEYAVHNRDNFRAIDKFTIPICHNATISNFEFHDIDQNAANDWGIIITADDVQIWTPDNPLRWNSIYSFRFDSNTDPAQMTSVVMRQFDPGFGAGSFTVHHPAPSYGGPVATPSMVIGPGCATSPPLPGLNDNSVATLGNADYVLRSVNNVPGQPNFLYRSATQTTTPIGPCNLYLGGSLVLHGSTTVDASGTADYPTPIPADPSLHGAVFHLQGLGFDPVGGPIFTTVTLSRGLTVTVSDTTQLGSPGCP